MNSFNRDGSFSYPSESRVNLQPIMRQVYVWMGLGTLLTALVAFLTVSTPLLNLALNPVILIVAMVAELGMVMGLSFGFNRLSAAVATGLFFVYAALNGFTLSIILLAYSGTTITTAFVATAALFGAMSIIGYTTQVDLTKMGTYLMMGLIGLLIAMVINIFVGSGPLDMLISVVGVLLFTGLTAFDTQRIGRMAASVGTQGEAAAKLGIYGALKLYLDFINMFLFMLRLMGGRRR
ncbi:MAG: Bax inhibitor-1/YccA family protein [Caldilineaceae bacterium]